MSNIPKFRLYGQDDPLVEESIQPSLALRKWGDLSAREKKTAFLELVNRGWVDSYCKEILQTIEYLNYSFLRQCPGKRLHGIKPQRDRDHFGGYANDGDRMDAASLDFLDIFLQEKSDAIVFRMLSKFAERHIDNSSYQRAATSTDEKERKELVESAFRKFDRLADCLNHIFDQFSVNQIITRNDFVPRQDEKITSEIYIPTLRVLSDPKWKSVSSDLAAMFEDYREENYPEVITKAHRAVQRFGRYPYN